MQARSDYTRSEGLNALQRVSLDEAKRELEAVRAELAAVRARAEKDKAAKLPGSPAAKPAKPAKPAKEPAAAGSQVVVTAEKPASSLNVSVAAAALAVGVTLGAVIASQLGL